MLVAFGRVFDRLLSAFAVGRRYVGFVVVPLVTLIN